MVQDARRAKKLTGAELLAYAVAEVNGLRTALLLTSSADQADFANAYTDKYAVPFGQPLVNEYGDLYSATDWEATPVVGGA